MRRETEKLSYEEILKRHQGKKYERGTMSRVTEEILHGEVPKRYYEEKY